MNTENLSIRRNVAWSLAGRIGYAGFQWLAMVLIARACGARDLGEYSYALALIGPVLMFSQLNMRSVQVSSTNEEDIFSTYFFARLITTGAGFVVVVVVNALNHHSSGSSDLLLALLTAKSVESIADIFHGNLAQLGNQRRVAVSLLLKSLAWILSLLTGIYVFNGIADGLWIGAISWILLLLLCDVKRNASIHSISTPDVIRLVKTSLPFGLVMALSSLIVYIPVYLLKGFGNSSDIGFFSSLMYFFLLGRMVVAAASEAFIPRLSRLYAANSLSDFWHTLGQFSLLVVAIGIASILFAIFFGDKFLVLCFGNAFGGHSISLALILCGAFASHIAQIAFSILTIARIGWAQLTLQFAVAATCAVIGFLRIPDGAVYGAAESILGAMLVMAALAWITVFTRVPQLWSEATGPRSLLQKIVRRSFG